MDWDDSKWTSVEVVVDHVIEQVKQNNETQDICNMLDPNYKEPIIGNPIIDHAARQQFGRDIRNFFGLWRDNTALAEDCLRIDPETAMGSYNMWKEEGQPQEVFDSLICGKVHPDDASAVIENELLKKLKEELA